MSKPMSSCCQKPARVNMNSADGTMFCTHCGQDCTLSQKRSGFGAQRSTLSTVRKPTGERELMVKRWAECKGRSQVSGEKLLPPEHPMFHFQGSHGLNKGTYPEYRLDPRNMFMVTVAEHEQWHAIGDKEILAKEYPKWAEIVRQVGILKSEAMRKNPSHATTN